MTGPLPDLLDELGLGALDASRATITGADPVLACRYPVAEAAACVLAATGLAASRLGELRGEEPQSVHVDVRHAGAHLRGFLDQIVDGEVQDPDPTGKLAGVGLFRAGDGTWVQTYGAFAPLRERLLEVLGCGEDRAAIARAVAGWGNGADLAEALVAAGTPGAVAGTAEQWEAHPQGRALRALPVVSVERVGDAPARPPAGRRGGPPLDGVRVLDATRVLAGPACGRALAELGADVLSVTPPHMHVIRRASIDTAIGKRSAHLDLRGDAGQATAQVLLAQADVVVQNARPGALARLGLGVQDAVRARPGVVYVSIDTFGHDGPWADRPGFEPLAQACTGWAHDHARDGVPTIVPALPCDYATGMLATLGVLDALARRTTEGGSWHVRASLCRTAMWLRDQPRRVDPADAISLAAGATRDLRISAPGGFGDVQQLTPALQLSRTPLRWGHPAMPAGTHPPRF